MDIDLLFTRAGEAGLISSENLVKKAAGAVLDTKTGLMTLEYVDSDYMELNISIDPDFFGMLDANPHIHIGAVKNGNIAQAYQVPLMFLDDPYRGQAMMSMPPENYALQSFNIFVRRCNTGQPVHRDDLANEGTMGCILGDAAPSSLQFAPHLARRHAMEMAPKSAPHHAPRMSGPGLGSSGGGGSVYKKPTDTKE
ncbi:MAG: hypothetical protein ACT4OY_05480 [Alphaproteobacteria bacterium]